ncbi:hypothetical protein FQN54_005115 [Arachnomyces sp. PD_36]|nr:hypothetical protein FQN54_005115 [Arachnomyces sp. PD_36]
MEAVPIADGPRFAPITEDDHRGIVIIIASLFMVWMVLCLIIRSYIRVDIADRFSSDDYFIMAASVVAVGQTAAVLESAKQGFGKRMNLLDDINIRQIEKATYASDILLIIALTLSKCSVCLLVRRLTQTKNHLIACYTILGVCVLWGIAGTVAIAVRCNLEHPWVSYSEQCPNLFLRWKVIGAFDIITEVALIALSMLLVWGLRMRVSSKLTVVFAFSFRLTVAAVIIVRLHYIGIGISSTDNPFFDSVPASICTQVELHWGLMAASIPCLKPFMKAMNTGYMGFSSAFLDHTTGSYALTSMSRSRTAPDGGIADGTGTPGGGPSNGVSTHITHVPREHPQEDGGSVTSGGSETRIIQKTFSWRVEYGDNPDTGEVGDAIRHAH